MLLGAAMAALTTNILPAEQLHTWGWRLPFLFGAVLGIFAIWLRRNLPRSSHFQKHDSQRAETSGTGHDLQYGFHGLSADTDSDNGVDQ